MSVTKMKAKAKSATKKPAAKGGHDPAAKTVSDWLKGLKLEPKEEKPDPNSPVELARAAQDAWDELQFEVELLEGAVLASRAAAVHYAECMDRLRAAIEGRLTPGIAAEDPYLDGITASLRNTGVQVGTSLPGKAA